MAVIYVILIVGAVTTLYPFALMASTGFKGTTDQNDNKLVPRFWSEIDTRKPDGSLDEASLYGKYLEDKYSGDRTEITGTRTGTTASQDEIQGYQNFLLSLPENLWRPAFRTGPNQSTSRLTERYQKWLRTKFESVEQLNKSYIEENVAFQTVVPPVELWERKGWKPKVGKKWDDWLLFKRELPAEFRLPIREQRVFQDFCKVKTEGQFVAVPADLAQGAKGFETIPLNQNHPWYKEFVARARPDALAQMTPEKIWRQSFAGPMPTESFEVAYIKEHQAWISREFSTRNFRFILDYILINGGAVVNTAIFCLLAILAQLTVNPLAAYAISRYPIRASGKILIFLLATMAFPAEVAMIPSFLLLKGLGLLNTFAALVLPTAASGYMIFLLKGFFDSLPSELFESGQLDGAKEWKMLWKIALPLSRPVLGYLALVAFMGAYGAFMYAFLVNQNRETWTLMVFLYQLQLTAPRAVVMAGLTIAAIPTLIVFLLAQRTIMRGIVLPGER